MSEFSLTGQKEDHRRLRPQIAATVHPDTVSRMHTLCAHYKVSRGALMDKLVLIAHAQYTSGRVYCMTGEPCRWNRADVPPIL
jgi:hypothetical protein